MTVNKICPGKRFRIINNIMRPLHASGYKTKKETVEEALKLLITLKNQASIRNFRGKLFWDGDLEKIRLDK